MDSHQQPADAPGRKFQGAGQKRAVRHLSLFSAARQVLFDISSSTRERQATALVGPCELRTLNHMNSRLPQTRIEGEVLINFTIYATPTAAVALQIQKGSRNAGEGQAGAAPVDCSCGSHLPPDSHTSILSHRGCDTQYTGPFLNVQVSNRPVP